MGVDILIPVNRLDRAKTRLAGLLTPIERRELALLTLAVVVEAARNVGPVTVLSADNSAAQADLGVSFMHEDPDLNGLNSQLEGAIGRLGGSGELLILHADLPLATAIAIADLVAASAHLSPPLPRGTSRERGPGGEGVAVRSVDGGTNAMLLRPPGRFRLAYGPGSFEKHMAAARAAGVSFVQHQSEALSLDLDSPADIKALLGTPEARDSSVARFLRGLNLEAREGWPAGA